MEEKLKPIFDFINNSSLITIIGWILPAIVSYKAATLTIKNNSKHDIALKQLQTIYLPLYHLIKNTVLHSHLSPNKIRFTFLKIYQIIDNNDELISPSLKRFTDELHKDLLHNNDPYWTYKKLHKRILFEYNQTKRILLYPSEPFISALINAGFHEFTDRYILQTLYITTIFITVSSYISRINIYIAFVLLIIAFIALVLFVFISCCVFIKAIVTLINRKNFIKEKNNLINI